MSFFSLKEVRWHPVERPSLPTPLYTGERVFEKVKDVNRASVAEIGRKTRRALNDPCQNWERPRRMIRRFPAPAKGDDLYATHAKLRYGTSINSEPYKKRPFLITPGVLKYKLALQRQAHCLRYSIRHFFSSGFQNR